RYDGAVYGSRGRGEGRQAGGVDRIEASVGSRVVDAFPTVDRSWDRVQEPVVVPSEVSRAAGTPPGYSDPFGAHPVHAVRRAETETVGGKSVYVLYRPSRGLEVRDNENLFPG
ncbi:MAG: magnesium transporter, partial [Sciscionella sp.]